MSKRILVILVLVVLGLGCDGSKVKNSSERASDKAAIHQLMEKFFSLQEELQLGQRYDLLAVADSPAVNKSEVIDAWAMKLHETELEGVQAIDFVENGAFVTLKVIKSPVYAFSDGQDNQMNEPIIKMIKEADGWKIVYNPSLKGL